MKAIFLATFFISFTFFDFLLFAQNQENVREGKLEVIQDYKIDQLMQKQIRINQKKLSSNGYRIQIHFGASRDIAKQTKSKFLSLFPEVKAYEIYQQPNYKVRVGNFRTKLEAQKLLKEIATDFPNSFIVQDEIDFPKN